MNTGSPPTERHARTGEFTPPGMTPCARSKISWLRLIDIARTVAHRLRVGADLEEVIQLRVDILRIQREHLHVDLRWSRAVRRRRHAVPGERARAGRRVDGRREP